MTYKIQGYARHALPSVPFEDEESTEIRICLRQSGSSIRDYLQFLVVLMQMDGGLKAAWKQVAEM